MSEESEIITYRVLSLGAGVQSTTLALMAKTGEVENFDVGVFADPGEESDSTYRHLEWLIKEVEGTFPVVTRTIGRLGDDLIHGVGRKTCKDGTRFASIPAFTKGTSLVPIKWSGPDNGDGVGLEEGVPVDWAEVESEGITRRQCTSEYKIEVVERYIRRELLELKPKQRINAANRIVQVFGLSFDELGRAMRVRNSFNTRGSGKMSPEFPLIEKEMTRAGCMAWLKAYGVPHVVPRSACVFCPYKSNSEWRRLKEEDPAGWARAVEVDDGIRMDGARISKAMNHKLYVHRSCVPLKEADLRDKDERAGQSLLPLDGYNQECAGMCGL